VSEVAIVIVSALVGAVAGFASTAWKSRKDLEAQYDIDLRTRRIEAYSELWKTLEPLAYHFPERPLTKHAATGLGSTLRRWYFQTGGLVLSSSTRPAYFNLQQALEGVSAPGAPQLEKAQHDILKALASRLRTSTTLDVATRIRPRIDPSLRATFKGWWRRGVFAPVRVTVDRRWDWESSAPRPAVFAIVQNLTNQELEITRVEIPGAGKLVTDGGQASFLLQPGEDREVKALATADLPTPIAPDVTIANKTVRRSRRTPAVPLASSLLARRK